MANLKISQLEKITNMDADAYILVVQNGKNYRMSIKEAIAANVDLGDVDLSNYYTKEEVYTKEQVRALIDEIQAGNIDLANYYTILEVDEKVEAVQDQIDTFKQETTAALATKLERSDLDPYAKTVDVVSKTTYDSDKQATDSAIEALETKVGNKAEGDTVASGLYKLISDTAAALREDITAIPKFKIEVVKSLPIEGISPSTVYLVKDKESVGDLYTEYIYVNNAWETLGKQTVDLSKYSTTEQMNAAISAAIADLRIGDYYKKTEVDNLLDTYVTSESLTNTLAHYVQTSALTSELSNYLKTSDFNAYKESVTQSLGNYVTNTAFNEYKGTVTAALETKLEQSDLDAYVTSESLTNTLGAYVTSDGLTTKLANYATKKDLSDGLATKADASSLDSYVLKTAITESTSLSYVGDKLEISSITEQDLNDIMHAVTK